MEIQDTKHQSVPLIDLRHISKRYGDIVVLRDINLKIDKGEFISLIGASGAGKSTLIRLIIREEKPSQGHIFIAGRDITELRDKDIPYFRRNIGVVFQDFKLIPHKSVKENISFALEVCDTSDDDINSRLSKILDLVSLKDRMNNYPHELSGGEKQRVAIARALIHSPKVLLADEPTGNLDQDNSKDIIDLLKKINQSGTPVILATHNRFIVDSLRKRVIKLENGKIVSDKQTGVYI